MRSTRHFTNLLPMLAVLAIASPAVVEAASARATIAGTATYRERVALPPQAEFEVRVEDVSRADAPTKVVAWTRTTKVGQVPIEFGIGYDLKHIDSRKTYTVRASIYEGKRLRFTGATPYPALGPDHRGHVTIMMHMVSAGDDAPAVKPTATKPTLEALPATFTGVLPCADCAGIRYQINLMPGHAYMQRMSYLRDGSDQSYDQLGAWSLADNGTLTLDGGKETGRWAVVNAQTLRKLDASGHPIKSQLPYELTRSASVQPMEPRVRLTGMFRGVADAPRFRECRSGLSWPVAMSGDYKALEHAYSAGKSAPGAELEATVHGRIESRPRVDGHGNEPTLIVEKFVAVMPGEECGQAAGPAALENSRWRLARIGSETVTAGAHGEAWIELDSHSRRVTGSGGCNRINGDYSTGRDSLRFGRIVATMMACPDMATEQKFVRVLNDTRRYRAQGRTLDLMDRNGHILARLEESNL